MGPCQQASKQSSFAKFKKNTKTDQDNKSISRLRVVHLIAARIYQGIHALASKRYFGTKSGKGQV